MTIKLERYAVWNYTNADKKITSYAVAKGQYGADLVVFKISDAYLQPEQQQRAKEYCDYLNKIIDATEEAYSQNQLVDTLKR